MPEQQTVVVAVVGGEAVEAVGEATKIFKTLAFRQLGFWSFILVPL